VGFPASLFVGEEACGCFSAERPILAILIKFQLAGFVRDFSHVSTAGIVNEVHGARKLDIA
jgi:hypothetical protein